MLFRQSTKTTSLFSLDFLCGFRTIMPITDEAVAGFAAVVVIGNVLGIVKVVDTDTLTLAIALVVVLVVKDGSK